MADGRGVLGVRYRTYSQADMMHGTTPTMRRRTMKAAMVRVQLCNELLGGPLAIMAEQVGLSLRLLPVTQRQIS